MARVVVGVPMYRSEPSVGEALGRLRSQSYEDFAIVAIDDCSPDGTFAVAGESVAGDPRVVVEANSSRLGSCGNWNRVLERALELHPDCELFAWASDNDAHEPRWLAAAVAALDENPSAVLAYSRGGTVKAGAHVPPRRPEPNGDELQAARGIDRMSALLRGRRDHAMFYGLHRVDALVRAGGKPRVLVPDILLLSNLALYGTFARCPDALWYRGSARTGGALRRQRAALFTGRPPMWSWLPAPVQHVGWLTRALVIGDRRPPGMSRGEGAVVVVRFCVEVARWRSRRLWSRLDVRLGKMSVRAQRRVERRKKRVSARASRTYRQSRKALQRTTRPRRRRLARVGATAAAAPRIWLLRRIARARLAWGRRVRVMRRRLLLFRADTDRALVRLRRRGTRLRLGWARRGRKLQRALFADVDRELKRLRKRSARTRLRWERHTKPLRRSLSPKRLRKQRARRVKALRKRWSGRRSREAALESDFAE